MLNASGPSIKPSINGYGGSLMRTATVEEHCKPEIWCGKEDGFTKVGCGGGGGGGGGLWCGYVEKY